jgi:parvulin-like peptidyl-prolyl isomerase
MLDYYHQHREEFEYPPRARWEMLLVRFSSYRSKAEAYRAIAALGNAVLDGEPFAEVARRGSEGATAREGGVYDWTTRGSLRSKIIDEAIFTLPVGQLSRILEDERGFAIVRVIERQEGGRVSFEEAQVQIRERLKKQHIERQIKEYLQEARKGIRVWTAFDDLPEEE